MKKLVLLTLTTFILLLTTCKFRADIKTYIDAGFARPSFSSNITIQPHAVSTTDQKKYVPSGKNITVTVPIKMNIVIPIKAEVELENNTQNALFSNTPTVNISNKNAVVTFTFNANAEPTQTNPTEAKGATIKLTLFRTDVNPPVELNSTNIPIECNSPPTKPAPPSYTQNTDTFKVKLPSKSGINADLKNLMVHIDAKNESLDENVTHLNGTIKEYKLKDKFNHLTNLSTINGDRSCTIKVYDRLGLCSEIQGDSSTVVSTTGNYTYSNSTEITSGIDALYFEGTANAVTEQSTDTNKTYTIPYTNKNTTVTIKKPALASNKAKIEYQIVATGVPQWMPFSWDQTINLDTASDTEKTFKIRITAEDKTEEIYTRIFKRDQSKKIDLVVNGPAGVGIAVIWKNAAGEVIKDIFTSSNGNGSSVRYIANDKNYDIMALPAGALSTQALIVTKNQIKGLLTSWTGSSKQKYYKEKPSATEYQAVFMIPTSQDLFMDYAIKRTEPDTNTSSTYQKHTFMLLDYNENKNNANLEFLEGNFDHVFFGQACFNNFNYQNATITLPSNTTEIGKTAFSNSHFKILKIKATTPPKITNDIFFSAAITEIQVPSGSVQDYKNQWDGNITADMKNKITGY